MVIDVGKLLQLAVTPGLVQVRVFPPADPETANVPVQATPFVAVAFHVKVPEKVLVVVVPETVPFAVEIAHVPDTELPAWVRFITSAVKKEPVRGCVP